MADEPVLLVYEDSLWMGDGIQIALYHTADKRWAAAPWAAVWVKPNDEVSCQVRAVTKDRALLRLIRELDVQVRNEHLGPMEEGEDDTTR